MLPLVLRYTIGKISGEISAINYTKLCSDWLTKSLRAGTEPV